VWFIFCVARLLEHAKNKIVYHLRVRLKLRTAELRKKMNRTPAQGPKTDEKRF
jgi:hypothetical protein